MPLQELPAGPAGSIPALSWDCDRFSRSYTELFAVSELRAREWANQEAMLWVDTEVATVVEGVDVGAQK
jgi:hypothetical protein